MKYFRNALSVISAVFLAEFIPALWWMFHNVNSEKATGLAVLPFAFLESLLSPVFWVLAITFFLLFLRASKMDSGALRVLLFWIPTVFFLSISLLFVGFLAYLHVHFRQHS